MSGFCSESGKIGYATRSLAGKARVAITRSKAAGPALNVFHCAACQEFHIGRPWGEQPGKRRRADIMKEIEKRDQ